MTDIPFTIDEAIICNTYGDLHKIRHVIDENKNSLNDPITIECSNIDIFSIVVFLEKIVYDCQTLNSGMKIKFLGFEDCYLMKESPIHSYCINEFGAEAYIKMYENINSNKM